MAALAAASATPLLSITQRLSIPGGVCMWSGVVVVVHVARGGGGRAACTSPHPRYSALRDDVRLVGAGAVHDAVAVAHKARLAGVVHVAVGVVEHLEAIPVGRARGAAGAGRGVAVEELACAVGGAAGQAQRALRARPRCLGRHAGLPCGAAALPAAHRVKANLLTSPCKPTPIPRMPTKSMRTEPSHGIHACSCSIHALRPCVSSACYAG